MRPLPLLLALLLPAAGSAQSVPAVDFDGAARGAAESPLLELARKPRPKPQPTPAPVDPNAPGAPSGTTLFHGVTLPARAFSRTDRIPSSLIEAIDATQSSLYLALYELNLTEVAAAIVRAKERGVDVKLIYDMGHGQAGAAGGGGEGAFEAAAAGPSNEYTSLVRAGVSTRLLKGGGSYGIMHNKIAVCDGELVVTGSFNWTNAADQENFENAVFRDDPSLAQLYTSYFNWMWPLGTAVNPGIISGTPTFGALQAAANPFGTPPADPSPSVQYKGAAWPRAVYSPNGGADAKLAEAIGKAQGSVDMAIFSLYSPVVADAVQAAAGRGVTVRVVADKSQAKRSPQVAQLVSAGVPLKLSSGRGGKGVLHHKFTVIDGELVELGSFNYSENAEKNNFENQFYTASGDDVAGYEAEFAAVWAQAHDPQAGEIEGPSTPAAP